MKKFLIFSLLFLAGCGTVKYVPVKDVEYVTVRDSVYFRDTTVQYQIEKQYVRDYTGMLDTLKLSTDFAEAEAFLDTTNNVLSGSIRNKDKVLNIPAQYKEKIVVRDSLVYKEVPVPVEVEKIVKVVPWWAKILSTIGTLSLLLLAAYVFLKFKKV